MLLTTPLAHLNCQAKTSLDFWSDHELQEEPGRCCPLKEAASYCLFNQSPRENLQPADPVWSSTATGHTNAVFYARTSTTKLWSIAMVPSNEHPEALQKETCLSNLFNSSSSSAVVTPVCPSSPILQVTANIIL